MKAILFWIFCIILGLAYQGDDNEKQTLFDIDPCTVQNTVFRSGETLVYKIYYNWKFIWVPAGEVRFTVRDSADMYIVEAFGETYPSYNWFFKVKDYYMAVLDTSNLLPVLAIRDVHEGRYKRYEKVSFDHDNRKAKSIRGRDKSSTNTRDIPLDACLRDILSVMYYIRSLQVDQMECGEFFRLKIYINRKSYGLKMSYGGVSHKKQIHRLGTFNTKKFHPGLLNSSVFKKGDKMTIWVTDDHNKLPLLIESDVSLGKIKAVLKSYEGLRHPLTARLLE